MDVLEQLVASLSKEEIRYYKLLAARTDHKDGRKDLELFDMMRDLGEGFDDTAAVARLYPGADRNPYYRLRNRVLNDLTRSLAMQHYEEDDVALALQLVHLARALFTRNRTDLALHFLGRAEKRASLAGHYEMLDLIYSEFIRMSNETVSINPESYIAKRKENDDRRRGVREIDDILASVKYRLKVAQNYSVADKTVMDLLEETVTRLSSNDALRRDPTLRFKLYGAVSQILLQRHDYLNLEQYTLSTYSEFAAEGLFNRANHLTRLQMLTYIVNALFKNGKLQESLAFAETLHAAMLEFDRLHYDRFEFFYYNSLVINYSKLDLDRAIALLEELETNESMAKAPYFLLFIHLNLAIFHFDKGEYRKAIKRINTLYHHDRFGETDRGLRFKIAMLEVLVRTGLDDTDYLESRIRQMRKEYADLLGQDDHSREVELLALVNELYLRGTSVHNKLLRNRIEAFLQGSGPTTEDAEIVNYNEWLRSKLNS